MNNIKIKFHLIILFICSTIVGQEYSAPSLFQLCINRVVKEEKNNLNQFAEMGWPMVIQYAIFNHLINLNQQLYKELSRAYPSWPKVLTLIENGAGIDIQNNYGETAISRATKEGNIDTVENLLQKGANPNLPDKYGKTALHKACLIGNAALARIILAHGADADYICGDTLHRTNHFYTLKTLLELGVNPDSLDHRGRSPLHKVKNFESAKVLLDFGANPNLIDNNGKTPLHTICTNAYSYTFEIIRLLLNHNAYDIADNKGNYPSTDTRYGYLIRQLLIDRGDNLQLEAHIQSQGCTCYRCKH